MRLHTVTFAALGCALFCTGGVAHASALEFLAADDHTAISIAGVRLAAGAVHADGDQVVVPIQSDAKAKETLNVTDATIRKVALVGGKDGFVVITLHHGRTTTRKLAAHTVVAADPAGIKVMMPRKQSLGTWQAPPVSDSGDHTTPAVGAAAGENDLSADTTVAPAGEIEAVDITSDFPFGRPDKSNVGNEANESQLALAPESTSVRGTVVLGIVLLAGALAMVILRRRKTPATGRSDELQLIGGRSVGAKARVILMRVRGREMVLGVSERGIGLLDSWPEEEVDLSANTTLDRAAPLVDRVVDRMADPDMTPGPAVDPVAAAPRSSSPAVSGLMKLRQQRRSRIPSELRSGDDTADQTWLRELAAAVEGKSAS